MARKNRRRDMIASQAPCRIWAIPFLIRRRATFLAGSVSHLLRKGDIRDQLGEVHVFAYALLAGIDFVYNPFFLYRETRKLTSLRRQTRRSVSNCALLQRRRTDSSTATPSKPKRIRGTVWALDKGRLFVQTHPLWRIFAAACDQSGIAPLWSRTQM